MLLKEADSKAEVVTALERLIAAARDDRRKALEREVNIIRAGMKGERDSAYLIDFEYAQSRNWVVIHDLRLEINGRVAQIDHLLINRFLEVFVLETKHFHAGLKITEEGEFLRWSDYKRTFEGMASPIAQNDRHLVVVRDSFQTIEMPTRLGIRLNPTFLSYVLVSAQARIDRPKQFDTSCVIKADALKAALNKRIDDMGVLETFGSAAKLISSETLLEVGQKLVLLHRPQPIDVQARFGDATIARTPTGGLRGSGPLHPSDSAAERPKPKAQVEQLQKVDTRPHCRDCGGGNLTILFGRSYYFKCADCNGNTPARVACGQPEHRERLRKDGRKFFRECADCGTSELYFVNPA